MKVRCLSFVGPILRLGGKPRPCSACRELWSGKVMSEVCVRCPICKREIIQGNPFRPFCSERCKLIDLNNWLSDRYRVSTPNATEGGDTGSGQSQRAVDE
jgi:uncharacterized protein